MDVHTAAQRSKNMSSIRSKNTKPELIVRRLLHGAGYRYRLHDSHLPGKPDIVFTRKRKVVFVNGCFWHSHDCKWGQVSPTTNSDFWAMKRSATVERDMRNITALADLNWSVATVWECELGDPLSCLEWLSRFLDN